MINELTKHIRRRIKASGIRALCRHTKTCGSEFIRIDVPSCGTSFTESEQREIKLIAKVNKLTLAKGMEIDIEQMTNPKQFVFLADFAL